MEEKRREAGSLPPASSSAGTVTAKVTETEPKSEPPSSRRRAGGQKRKSNNLSASNSTPSKRLAREKALAPPLASIHNGPCTRARQSPNNVSSAAAATAAASGALQKLDQPEAAPGASSSGAGLTAEELNVKNEDWEALEAEMAAEFEAIRSRDANVHVVPSSSGWFSWTKVHPLEEQAMPSFFNGKSENRNPDMYKQIRDWIIKRFHGNPNTQIEVKDLSELEIGDLDARQEVMEFLDYWGLINFHPFLPAESSVANGDDDTAKQLDSSVEKLYRFDMVQSCPPVVPKANMSAPTMASGLFPESAFVEELVRSEGPSVEYHCNSCSADCSRKRYHCQKQADFDLCTECFNNQKFGSDMSSSDFILMEPAEAPGVSGGKWTDQETLLLLEALELYKENWNEIAEHVATKTKAQCILHFVQMPIEDTFIDCDDETNVNPQENADPVSANNDSSVPKDIPESTESKTDVSEGHPPSSAMETSKPEGPPLSSPMETSKPESQPPPSPMETSKPEGGNEMKDNQETGEACALKALREAFEAVGSLPTPGAPLTFTDAGNPVMALAVFLTQLVGSGRASAAVHSSLKSMSSNSPGMQLAARHCYILEDPPDDKKEQVGSESATAEMVDQDAHKDENMKDVNEKDEKQKDVNQKDASQEDENQKHENQKELNQKEENQKDVNQREEHSISVLEGSDTLKDQNENKIEDSVPEEKLSVPPNGECTEKSLAAKEPDVVVSNDSEPGILSQSSNSDLPKDCPPNSVDKSDDLTPKAGLLPSSMKESGDGASVKDHSQPSEAPKDVDTVPESLPLQTKEPLQSLTSNTLVENGANTGRDQTKEGKSESHDSSKTKPDPSIDKIKRAATSALSAAAVKAKLLANQEEDQIQQFATLLIEKQLHKLETKLAFFNEMESVITRVREQMDRSRQRLYHERAQIIAARLGFAGSSSRPTAPSLPINRPGMSFPTSVPRPPMGMTSQRPPMSRPMMMAPSSLNTLVSSTVAGSSIRPPSQDKLSSVGTK